MHKKMISLLLTITLSCILLAGCSSTGQPTGAAESVPDTAETGTEPEGDEAENVVVDPALENEVKVTSAEPYVMSGDQTYFIEDKELNNGYKMPVLGLGTYALTVEEAENSVYHAQIGRAHV